MNEKLNIFKLYTVIHIWLFVSIILCSYVSENNTIIVKSDPS